MAPSPDHPNRAVGRPRRLAAARAAAALASPVIRFTPGEIEQLVTAGVSLDTAAAYADIGLDVVDTVTAATLGLDPDVIARSDPNRDDSDEQRLLRHNLHLQSIQTGLRDGYTIVGFGDEHDEPDAVDGYRYVTCEAAHPETGEVVTVRLRFDTRTYGSCHQDLQRLTGRLLTRGTVQDVANPDLVTPSPYPQVFDVTEVLLAADKTTAWARFIFERRTQPW